MKKIFIMTMCVLLFVNIFWFYSTNNDVFASSIQNKADQQSIAKKIIRFHILANSDSNEDQAVKLKVRDEVLEYIAPMMNKCNNIEQSRKVLKENDKKVQQIAQEVLRKNGYSYGVRTELAEVQFPVKSYGAIILPQGQYEAYRILIGKAEGHNWWCVMFPPLCFTDITKGDVEVKKTEKEMKSVLTPEEYNLVCNSNEEDDSNDKIVVKFKVVEEFDKLVSYIKGETSK